MIVFADFHHSDLKYSLQLLFEKRLGHTLYFPIGMEWYEEGYWNVFPHIDTARQYLDIRDTFIPPDGTPPLTQLGSEICVENGIEHTGMYYVNDAHNQHYHKAITFSQFKDIKIDIVIASLPQHIKPFKELIAKYQPQAKLIVQCGNVFPEIENNLHDIPNLMANTLPFILPSSLHYIQYHQEFDTTIFKPSSEGITRQITSFINCYHDNAGYTDYASLKASLPDYEFKSYGGGCDDGCITTTEDMATIMQRSQFGFHSKRMGDGFGHTLYNWFACGRPVITRISDYKEKLGEELLIHGETCFDLDICNIHELSDIIRNIPPHKYQWMREQTYKRFQACVDWHEEAKRMKDFLTNLR